MSAYQAGIPDDENIQNTSTMRKQIADAGYRYNMVLGSWEGQRERTFMVAVSDMDDVNKLAHIASLHSQDSILYRNEHEQAWIIDKDGTNETLGKMVQVHKDVALAQDSWTQDPATGAFYIIKYGD